FCRLAAAQDLRHPPHAIIRYQARLRTFRPMATCATGIIMKLEKKSSSIRVAIGSLVLAALATLQASAADYNKENKDTTDLKHKDTTFIKQAAEGGMLEVQLGQIGAQKAQNDQVKQL